ncbi:MAG TPA: HAMP domain-containing sensor histidine kinase [bacterium]|nr:HAMP domain-containing sensor histidine kinase [bacterium]
MSLRLRLTLFGVGLVALALLVFGLLLYALLARGVNTNQDDALRTRAQQAVASLKSSSGLVATQPVAPEDLRTSTDVFVEVFDQGWAPVYSTAEPIISPNVHAGFGTQGGFRLYVAPFDRGYVVTGQSTKVPQSNLSGVVVFLVISAIAGLVAGLIAIWVVAGRALAPLKRVAVTADEIGRTRDFARRLPVNGSRDEVGLLASSFNGMLGQLQDAFESQRRFVSDASHELRTPLTTIQGNAGLLASRSVADEVRRAAAEDVVKEGARMARLVDRLLTLAGADSGLGLTLAPLELKPLVEEVCRQAAAQHGDHELSVDAADVRVDGDDDALRQLLWILLDNAFRFATSAVDVSLSTEDGWARLLVADDGPGVPSEHRERIFERFYRADSSRAGSHAGLGLSIARWIVAQHGGRIIAGEAKLGGAAFLVDLPLLPAS